MSRILAIALLAISVWGLAPRTAIAHLPPPITFSFAVDAEEVTWEMTVSVGIFEEWLPPFAARDITAIAEEGGARYAELTTAAGEMFARWGHVEIDGIPVRGVVRKVVFEEYMDHMTTWEFVMIRVGYPTKGKPRQVRIAWTHYNGGLGGYFDRIESEIDGFGETNYQVLRAREPEFIWHAPRAKPIPRRLRLPESGGPPRVYVPLVSWGILAVLLLLVPILGLAGTRRGVAWGIAAAGMALALGFADTARTEIPLPFGPSFERPSEDEAEYLFEALLRNVYRAFDHDTEDAIYDTLEESVRGDLLSDIYLEVYEGLILEEEGGAVSTIKRVEIVEQKVLFPADEHARHFDVRARWQVTGRVDHAGHWHVRVNEYVAVFTLTLEDERWKLAKMHVLARERVDEDE